MKHTEMISKSKFLTQKTHFPSVAMKARLKRFIVTIACITYSKNPWNKHILGEKFKVFKVTKGATSIYHCALKGVRNSLKKKRDRWFLQGSVSTTALLIPKQNNDKTPTFFNETRKNTVGRFTVTHTTNKPASQSCQYSTIRQINGWRNLN